MENIACNAPNFLNQARAKYTAQSKLLAFKVETSTYIHLTQEKMNEWWHMIG